MGPKYRVTLEVQIPCGKGHFWWIGAPPVQKRLNRSICHFGCGLQWAEGCTSSIVFARWRQWALMGGDVAGTSRMTLNHPTTAAMCLMANYFNHLLDMPTYTLAQTAKRFEPSTVLWTFHTIQPSSCTCSIHKNLLHSICHMHRHFYSTPLCMRCISYGSSVCPSHAYIVSKRRHIAQCSLHCRIAKCV